LAAILLLDDEEEDEIPKMFLNFIPFKFLVDLFNG
jgi:hypothetical protein